MKRHFIKNITGGYCRRQHLEQWLIEYAKQLESLDRRNSKLFMQKLRNEVVLLTSEQFSDLLVALTDNFPVDPSRFNTVRNKKTGERFIKLSIARLVTIACKLADMQRCAYAVEYITSYAGGDFLSVLTDTEYFLDPDYFDLRETYNVREN